ncbi:MAG: hypothetical protein K9J06_02490 [Flavobacteriales bacterium]|nr:hypothetical protein [Flavobacteriales bacterium]
MTGPCDRNLTERLLREYITAVTGIIQDRFPELYVLLMEAPLRHPEQLELPDTNDLCDHLDSLNRQLQIYEQAYLAAGCIPLSAGPSASQ